MDDRLTIHAKYQKAAENLLRTVTHEGTISDGIPGKISSQAQGVLLSIVTNHNGTITDSKYSGAKGAHRAILEGLCSLAKGRTVRELSEHGLIYLENQMRDPSVQHEIKGLLTPENVDPSFQLPLRLVRDLYRQNRASAKFARDKNFWTPKPGANWSGLSDESRIKRLQTELSAIKETLKSKATIEIVTIRNLTRLVASVTGYPNPSTAGAYLMKVEQLLKERVEPLLELVLESVEDRNKRIGRTQIARSNEANT